MSYQCMYSLSILLYSSGDNVLNLLLDEPKKIGTHYPTMHNLQINHPNLFHLSIATKTGN